MSPSRLLILPVLFALGACTGDTLTFEARTGENLPETAVERNYTAATTITCLRGAQKEGEETSHSSSGDLHSYDYSCNTPSGAPASSGFWNIF